MSEQIVVVGGNAAGMTAASRAARLDPDLDIQILEASRFISYSICGLPYYVAQMLGRHSDLVQFTPRTLKERRGIRACTGARVVEILPGRRRVRYLELESGRDSLVRYDRLVIATGYKPLLPRFIPQYEIRGLLTVSRLEDGIQLQDLTSSCRKVIVVGGGYIGLNPLIFPNYFGRQHVGSIRGAFTPLRSAAAATGPLAIAWMFDLTGSYDIALKTCIVMLIFGAFAMIFAPAPTHPSKVRL